MPADLQPKRGSTKPRSSVVLALASAIVAFALFRLADGLNLVPADQGGATTLSFIAALLAGGAALAGQLGRLALAVTTRWFWRLCGAWLIAVGLLSSLYLAFVFPVPDLEGRRTGSVVVSYSRAGCDEAPVDCRGQTNEKCLEGIGWRQDLIAACWGEGRILVVSGVLLLSALLVSGGFGGLVGLGALSRQAPAAAGPLRLFLCYRRADSGRIVDHLHQRLAEQFGNENVFRDVEDIRLGGDFRQQVRRALSACDVFLMVIGPGWLDARDDQGARRLDREDDPVLIEIETAIARGLRIVPVLVGGAGMPRGDEMPSGLRELSNRGGSKIQGEPENADDAAFDASVAELIRALERHEVD